MSASETCHKGIIGSQLVLFTISIQGTLDLLNHKWFNVNIRKCPFTYFECATERKFVLFIWTFADGTARDCMFWGFFLTSCVSLSPKFMSGLMRFFLWTCLGLSELRGEKCALCFESFNNGSTLSPILRGAKSIFPNLILPLYDMSKHLQSHEL